MKKYLCSLLLATMFLVIVFLAGCASTPTKMESVHIQTTGSTVTLQNLGGSQIQEVTIKFEDYNPAQHNEYRASVTTDGTLNPYVGVDQAFSIAGGLSIIGETTTDTILVEYNPTVWQVMP